MNLENDEFQPDHRCCDQSDVLKQLLVDQRDNLFPYQSAKSNHWHRWKHTHLTVDVVDGRGGGFSLESPEGKRFLIRSRLFTDQESVELEKYPVTTGAQ